MSPPVLATPPSTLDDLRRTLHALQSLAALQESRWIASCLVITQQSTHRGQTAAQALKEVLTGILAKMAQSEPDLADLLRGRFWEGQSASQMVAAERPVAQSERRLYEQQTLALELFAALLTAQEEECRRTASPGHLLARLPLPSYQQLFGVETVAQQLLQLLGDPQRHPIVSIKGIGGIGKKALAHYAVRPRVASGPPLEDLLWISAKQALLTDSGLIAVQPQTRLEQLFDDLARLVGLVEILRLPLAQKVEQLANKLRTAPYLVVLDNLESVADFRITTRWLAQLAGPTQFLLTARETIPALTPISQVELGELTERAALELIAYTATTKGVNDKTVNGFDPHAVYSLVGGNPLAILLVVSQMSVLPASRVLARIQRGDSEDLYSYIFRNAWSILSYEAKMILLTLQRAGDSADWEWLQLSSALPPARLDSALEHLRQLSLVQPQQGRQGRLEYTIHRLTSTFLTTEVLGWK